MTRPFIAPIVEGHGEVEAVRGLLFRIAAKIHPALVPQVNPPIRVKAGSFLTDDAYFRRHVELACLKAAEYRGFVLVLLDCEDACPAELGPDLVQRAQEVRADVPIVVALAYREYETWFLTAAASLRGRRGLPEDLEPPDDPEALRDAKGWLGNRMPDGYDPVRDQSSLTEAFELSLAEANGSFRRLVRVVGSQLGGMNPPS